MQPDVSKGRFERLQCVKCGAHALVPASRTAAAMECGVCGAAVLEPVPEPPAFIPPLAPRLPARRAAD